MFDFKLNACGTCDYIEGGLARIFQDRLIGRALHLHGAPFSVQAPPVRSSASGSLSPTRGYAWRASAT